jgi:hypothetical protein
MAEKKILQVEVKETDVNVLPKEIQAPGKDRTFDVLREDKDRYLCKMPAGIGHQADTPGQDSWWVSKEACKVTKQEGGEEEKKMSEVKKDEKKDTGSKFEAVKTMVIDDATQALYIVAGTQLTTVVRMACLKIVRDQLTAKYGSGKGAKSKITAGLEGVESFLDSPFGQATIMAGVGYGLNYIPGVKDDRRAQQLSKTMRIQGIAVGTNAIVGAAVEHVGPAIFAAIQNLPALPEVQLADVPATVPEVEHVSAGSSAGASASA